jgi:ubiquinone biosynthesis protein
MDATDETSETRTETPSPDPLFELIGSITRLTRRVALNADQLAEQVVSDAGSVARDAEAFGRAAAAGWSKLQRSGQAKWRDLGRAAPRVARVTTEGGKLIALYQWHRLLAQAGGHGLPDEAHRKLASRAREACIELRGGVLKLGQILSCRPDLVGPIWAAELAELQDRVPPVDSDAIIAGIEAELGAPIGELFADFAREPVAAASLAQVHLARLADGREVAVKALVPGIEDVIEADIAAMKALGPMLSDVVPGADLATIVAEMSRSLREELDYRAEAEAARELAGHLGGGTLFVPEVIASHSAQRVMTMARVDGARLGDHLDGADATERSRVIAAMVEGVARQVFVTGLVHADPHPGNFLVTADGRVAVLDFGCVLRLGPDERRGYARALGALVSRNPTAAADALAALGFVGDRDALLNIAGRVVDALRPGVDASAIDWQEAFRGLTADLAAAGKAGGVTVPRSFVLLGRVLATVAGLIVQYKPKLEPFALLAPHVAVALRT